MTVLEIVEKIIALMGGGLQAEIRNETTNEILHQYLNAEKARKVLNWKPLFTLDESLIRTIAWYKDFFGVH